MSKKPMLVLLAICVLILAPRTGHAHCQVPCGIYDDAARIARMHEDAATIEKAMQKIQELVGQKDAQSANQLTRWIITKENHATNIITTVSEYFLTQKVKPVEKGSDGFEAYLQKLADHHQLMIAAMKTKQNVDMESVAGLRAAIDSLGRHYDVGPAHQH